MNVLNVLIEHRILLKCREALTCSGPISINGDGSKDKRECRSAKTLVYERQALNVRDCPAVSQIHWPWSQIGP